MEGKAFETCLLPTELIALLLKADKSTITVTEVNWVHKEL
jgi:hypothetical protein